jgi:hypothetical protein
MTESLINFSPAPCHVLPITPRSLPLNLILEPSTYILHEAADNMAVPCIIILMILNSTSKRDENKFRKKMAVLIPRISLTFLQNL